MTFGQGARDLTNEDVEIWLRSALVPIEPDERFIHRLRARLIHYQGDQPFSGWRLVGVVVTMVLILLTWMSLIFRVVLVIFSLFSLLNRHRRKPVTQPVIVD
jgi:hypothetical protein